MDILPAPINIYLMNKRPSSAETNVGNFHHVVVELNI